VVLTATFFTLSPLEAAYARINGKWSDEKYSPTLSVTEHYDLGHQCLFENKWDESLKNFMVIVSYFDTSPFYSDALFYTGVCHYFLGEYDLANAQFTKYLDLGGNLKYFEKVFEFKYYIAEQFANGYKRRPFGLRQLPRVLSSKSNALDLYDEVIASLPTRDLAAKALFGKAGILRGRREFRESIETLQTLTRRFPKHSLAADAYLTISEIYLEQSRLESQNPDLLALAQINLTRFYKSFPGDERILQGERHQQSMKEVFAQSLYDTGRFYEKKKKKPASQIYYVEAVRKYPDTLAAEKSLKRLEQMGISLEDALAKNVRSIKQSAA